MTKDTKYKLLQYAALSSPSVLSGYFFYNNLVELRTVFGLVLLFPLLYCLNYSYFQLLYTTQKYVIPIIRSFTSAPTDKLQNVIGAQAFVFNLIVVYYLISEVYYPLFPRLHFNSLTLVLLMLFTAIFFLRRSIRTYDKTIDIPLLSILKHDAYKHTHVLAAATVGVPYLYGLATSKLSLTAYDLAIDFLLSEFMFLFAWVVLYHHKNKAIYFLDNTKYANSYILYPIFPIVFFMVLNPNSSLYYLSFCLFTFIYYIPLLYTYSTSRIFDAILNEKIIAFILLACITVFSYTKGTYHQCTNSYSYNSAFLVSMATVSLALVLSKNRIDDLNRVIIKHIVYPFLIYVLMYTCGYLIINKLSEINSDIHAKLCELSTLLEHSLIIYLILSIIIACLHWTALGRATRSR